MTNTISKPTWLYKIIEVPSIDQIKQECMDVFYKHYPDVFGNHGFTFTYADQDILRAEVLSNGMIASLGGNGGAGGAPRGDSP